MRPIYSTIRATNAALIMIGRHRHGRVSSGEPCQVPFPRHQPRRSGGEEEGAAAAAAAARASAFSETAYFCEKKLARWLVRSTNVCGERGDGGGRSGETTRPAALARRYRS